MTIKKIMCSRRKFIFLSSLFFLQGCNGPIVDTVDVHYKLKYEINNVAHDFDSKFVCRYEGPLWSEAGNTWQIDSASPFNIVSKSEMPDGSPVEITLYEYSPIWSDGFTSVIGYKPERARANTLCTLDSKNLFIHIDNNGDTHNIPFGAVSRQIVQLIPLEDVQLKSGSIHFLSASLTGKKGWAVHR